MAAELLNSCGNCSGNLWLHKTPLAKKNDFIDGMECSEWMDE
jgi:hypothetical protein